MWFWDLASMFAMIVTYLSEQIILPMQLSHLPRSLQHMHASLSKTAKRGVAQAEETPRRAADLGCLMWATCIKSTGICT